MHGDAPVTVLPDGTPIDRATGVGMLLVAGVVVVALAVVVLMLLVVVVVFVWGAFAPSDLAGLDPDLISVAVRTVFTQG